MATYYVSTVGSDSTGTGTLLNPWRNPPKALQSMSSGDTLYIRAGTYSGITWASGYVVGTSFANAPLIQAYQNEAVTINFVSLYGNNSFAYVIFQDLTFGPSGSSQEPCLVGGNAGSPGGNHIRFVNCTTTGSTTAAGVAWFGGGGGNEYLGGRVHHNGNTAGLEHGIYLHTGGNDLIDGVEVDHNYAFGIAIYNSNLGGNDNTIIRNCLIHDNGAGGTTNNPPGIGFQDGNNIKIYNNIVYNEWYGIATTGSALTVSSAKVYNNTIYNCTYSGLLVADSCDLCEFKNNISKNNGNYGIWVQTGATNTTVSNNDFHGNSSGTILNQGTGTTQSGNITTDPLFTDAANHDFTLTASSPCRDTGLDTSPTVTTDYISTARPQNSIYDIGAFEYIVTVPPTVLPVFETFTGTGALSNDWTQLLRSGTATLSRSSDQCKGDILGNDCMAYWTSASFNAAQYSLCTIGTGLGSVHYAELLVRASGQTGTANCYGVATNGIAGSPNTFLFKMLSNTVTILTGISTVPVNGNRIRLTISTDNKLKFWIDSGTGWKEIATYDLGASPEIVAGSAGLGVYDETTQSMRLDTWEGGNYSPGSGLLLLGMGS